jgi:hypothetical protein
MKVTKSILKQMILEGIDEVFAPGDPRYKATTDISGLTHNKGKRDPGDRDVMRYTVSSETDVSPGQVKDYAHKELAKGHPADVRISKIDERSYRVTIRFIRLDEEVDENLLDIAKNARDFLIPKKNKPLTADQALQQVQDILADKELPTAKKLKTAHDFLMLNLYPKDAPALVEKGEE